MIFYYHTKMMLKNSDQNSLQKKTLDNMKTNYYYVKTSAHIVGYEIHKKVQC